MKMIVRLKGCAWKVAGVLASMALLVTTANVNATCAFIIYQPELPQGAEKLRKF